ncbi:MAG: symbB [Actinomycetia bacterium]|nr:symbB [Actinomycetes bacterium]
MEEREQRRIPLAWLLAPYAVMVVAGYVGDIIGPKLIVDHPLLQIFINPRNRWLLLASPQVAAAPFFIVGFIRLVLTDPIAYVLGWQYGDTAIRWAEKKMGDDGGMIKTVERWFGKAAPLVILIAPSFYWCVLAGAARMKPRLFIALNITGTIGRLILFRLAGEAFRSQLETVLEWVQRYQLWLVGLSFVLVAIQVFRKGDVETPVELAEEIEAEESTPGDA